MTMIHNDLSPTEQRNAEICAMHKNGASYHHIAHTYNLSVEAVRGVCLKDQFLSQREQRKQNHSDLKEDTNLYVLMVEHNRFYRKQGGLSALPLRSYNRVCHFWRVKGNNGYPTVEFFLQLPVGEFAAMRNVGEGIMSFITTVQDNYKKTHNFGGDSRGQRL